MCALGTCLAAKCANLRLMEFLLELAPKATILGIAYFFTKIDIASYMNQTRTIESKLWLKKQGIFVFSLM